MASYFRNPWELDEMRDAAFEDAGSSDQGTATGGTYFQPPTQPQPQPGTGSGGPGVEVVDPITGDQGGTQKKADDDPEPFGGTKPTSGAFDPGQVPGGLPPITTGGDGPTIMPPPTIDPNQPPPEETKGALKPEQTDVVPGGTKPVLKPAEPEKPKPYAPTPAPPPAPRTTSTAGRIEELYKYGQQAMANPSRYDSELMKMNAQVIEDAINRMRQTGMRNLGEHFASRGLTGSSLEGFGVVDLENELGRYGRESTANLMTDAARTFAQDRGQAFGMGLGAAGLGESAEGRMADQDYRNWSAEQGFVRQDRAQDQNELALLRGLVDRFGPDVLKQLGYA